MKLYRFTRKVALAGVAASTAAFLFSPAVLAQNAGVNDDVAIEEVMVTGYRESLEAALNIKRGAANSVESIVAEDIGKMPDLNLAESIQRVPGVAITREGGEGRNITVRGLGPDFTRTTLNGMEVPASAGGIDSAGGVNRSRSVDFNIFASELFNRIDIHKTQRASIEEGGLASTIELYTPKPFDNPGFHVSAGAQITVDNLADENDPRFTALIGNTFLDDTLGVLLSVAQSERTVRQEGFGTVRFSSPERQGDTWACGDCPGTTVNGTFGTFRDENGNNVPYDINTVFTPRLPRMDYFSNTVDRTGITFALQFRPSDKLELGLDYLTSELENDRISYNYAAQFRNLWDSITPLEIALDPTGSFIAAGSFTNVRPRSESRGQFSTTDFAQTVFNGSYDISDRMELSFMAGRATSEHDEEQYRFNIDGPVGGAGFSFDMTQNPNIAAMSYGFDILDTSNYTIGGGTTIRKDVVDRTNDTIRFDLAIEGDVLDTKVGIISNTREVDSLRGDPVGLTQPASNTPVDNFPGLAVTFRSQVGGGFASALDAPSGFPTNWMVEDFDVARALYSAGDFEPNPTDGATFSVEEETLGAYGEVNYETELASRRLLVNAGVRFVETDTKAAGASEGAGGQVIPEVASSSYSNTLPSLNLVWDLRDDLQARFSWAKNINRPSLENLVPRVTDITVINGNVSQGNPDLDPIESDSIDLGIEWYFAEESLLAFTWFTKDITGFIASETFNGVLPADVAAIVALEPEYDPTDPNFDPTALDPFTDPWNLEKPINGQNADVDGYEITYQQPFNFLPGILSNFGIIANYTHVESEAGFDTGTGVRISTLPGLSEESYNLTLYYETDVWGARISTNSRDDYITQVSGSNGNVQEKNTGPTRVDMSAFYNMTNDISIRLEVINLNEEEERNYTTGLDGTLNLVREFNSTGREVYLGARLNF